MLFKKPYQGWQPSFPKVKTPPAYLFEVLLIILWTLWVGKAYLNFDPTAWPYGREYGQAVYSHYLWQDLLDCGTCVFWNGTVRGGAPAFSELQGSILHPIVIITTLLFGVVNGSKLVLLSSLIIAGIAQWWLAKKLQVGQLARLWTAGMAVVGGHLAGRMELGLVGMVLSTAMSSLAIASVVDLSMSGKRRSAIALGLILALLILSGQGYMQIGFLIAIVPALIVFAFDKQYLLKPIWKEYILAGVLALLLASVFLVPLLHFMPNIDKIHDSTFGSFQELAYIPLNLIINDEAFFRSEILKPLPYPNFYITFLGWVPVLLAVVALRFTPKKLNRVLGFFLLAIGLSFLAASGTIFRWISHIYPSIDAVRFPSYISGLANPLILGMAALGLDGLLKYKLPRLALLSPEAEGNHKFVLNINSTALILLIPLVISLKSAYVFGQNWLGTVPTSPELWVDARNLKTETSEWVNIPFGEHFWNIPVLAEGIKIGNAFSAQVWRGRDLPPAYLEATNEPIDPNNPNLVSVNGDINTIRFPENEYAYILSGDQKIPCVANAIGGTIEVNCPDSPEGILVVTENNWQGWRAQRDQLKTPLLFSTWLSVEAPAGVHNYSFRYKPWDVWVGFCIMLSGTALCFYLWIKAGKRSSTPSPMIDNSSA